jgi:hypothetical protein
MREYRAQHLKQLEISIDTKSPPAIHAKPVSSGIVKSSKEQDMIVQ